VKAVKNKLAVALGLAVALAAAWWWWQPNAPPTSAEHRRQLRIAAAADLQFALEEIIGAFQQGHSDIHMEAVYGSSGNFYSQLINHAPFDMFLAADLDYPRRLVERGAVMRDSLFVYAVGRLAVWVRRDSRLNFEQGGLGVLADPSVKKIAIANPEHAPYGKATVAALRNLHVYDQVRDRLVYGDNVAQAAHFVRSGAADAGVIAMSLALAPALKEAGRLWEVPISSYPRLEQGCVTLSWTRDPEAARLLSAFLTGPEGRQILSRYGLALPAK
jgi:molybdate transport system substrate-binding protein